MHGPIAARMSAGSLPNAACIASTARFATPSAVPRQPEWTAPTAPRTGSQSRIGVQSAEKTARATPGSFVISPSQSGAGRSRPSPQFPPVTRRTRSPWT